MHEAVKPRALERILGRDEDTKSYASERQLTAQAFALHVDFKDGRESENVSWSHFRRARWKDDGEIERLLVLFTEDILVIEGFNLKLLEDEMRECKLNRISEMSWQEAALKKASGTTEPIISAISLYPDLEEILMEIKGESSHDKSSHFGRTQR
jgi:hypothetical protein